MSTVFTESWDAKGITLAHKYTDPVLVDINITNAGERPGTLAAAWDYVAQ
jgi:hypothetical protein